MSLSPAARSLVDAAAAILRDDGPGFIAAIKARDWKQAALDVALAELKLAAALHTPGAALALSLAPLARALAVRPADSAGVPMAKAAGGEGGQNISTGA